MPHILHSEYNIRLSLHLTGGCKIVLVVCRAHRVSQAYLQTALPDPRYLCARSASWGSLNVDFYQNVLMFQETMSAMADDEEPIPAHDGPSESEGLGMPPVRGKRRPSLRGSASNVRSPPASQANNHGTSLRNSLFNVLYWQREEGISCIQTVGAQCIASRQSK